VWRGLLVDGYNQYTRNMNYFGEILIYASFNVIAQVPEIWFYYIFVWVAIFGSRMIGKDYELSKKEGWEEYKKLTWMLVPKLWHSAFASFLVYSALIATAFFTYEQGGIEKTIKLFKASAISA